MTRHLPTEQLRAAKVLKPKLQEDEVHELNMMKRLKHPSLPQIIDILEEDGRFWLIMEYIDGKCLTGICGENVTADLFFSIAGQLAEVLVYLHSRPVPILHLDIKPTNILLKPNGRIVLIDFGASILYASGERARFGTKGFAAPEQQECEGEVDVRTDIYGFGALMYYYLYGYSPKNSASKKKLKKRKAAWEKYADRILKCCLQEEKDKRYDNSKLLRCAIGRAEKRYLWEKQLKRGIGAIAFLVTAVVFAVRNLTAGQPENQLESKQEEYGRILQMSEGMGFSQALSCYEAAAGLCPSDGRWCLHLLERIEVDYLFSFEEEEALKKLLYMADQGESRTVLEILQENPAEYGKVAYRIGVAYWYFYEGTGGKSAGSKWFEWASATLTGNDTADWAESARIHADIGAYYEKLEKKDENGKNDAGIWDYWQDLKRLWRSPSLAQESVGIRMQVAEELLACLVMRVYGLYQSGETQEEMLRILEEVGQFCCFIEDQTVGKQELLQQCELAQGSIERVFAKGGKEIEVKTKKQEETK